MGIAWGVTGAGHLLEECVNLIAELEEVDVFLSRAAEEVLRMYRLESDLRRAGRAVVRDTLASAPVVGRFARSRYRVLVIAPATSNSVAKFVYGISDSLITNLFAQAGKNRVPIIVLPTDVAPEMDTTAPRGKVIKVYPRAIDLENTARLREFPGVTVAENIEGLRKCLITYS
ncbi:MAG TPA: flavoprotein [Anaerolineae bacterium]|nr:flavoprotein [Anaerolineae bacterium]